MNNRHYYVVIVGSGPAGLGVAEVLKNERTLSSQTLIIEKGNPLDKRTCVVRQGKKCSSCKLCNIISGVGGAGPYTDGKICLFEQDLSDLFPRSEENENHGEVSRKINDYLKKVEKIWTNHGAADLKKAEVNKKEVNEKMEALKAKALKHGIRYICYPVLHIGSDGAKNVIQRYVSDCTSAGIRIETNSNVTAIKRIDSQFEITYQKTNDSNGGEIKKVTADFLVLALGRDMQKATHIEQLLDPLGLTFKPRSLEIGCRVEVPYEIMEEVTQITFDPKFIMDAPTHEDLVRTFCTCHRGKVAREGNRVNGHVDRTILTQNTNFAILVSYSLKDFLMADAMDLGNTIAKIALSHGKGKPIIQRLGDLRKGSASTAESIKRSYIKPTLRVNRLVTPGDIASCYPGRIIDDILEGLEMLSSVIEGINNNENLLYAPEIKPTCSVGLKEGVKTKVANLYVCGDFSGYTRGIAQATCMGIMVGEDILNEVRKGFQLRFG